MVSRPFKICLVFFGLLLACPDISADAAVFRVQLRDKKYSPYSLDRPWEFLSRRSIDRRTRQGLKLDQSDLPVSPVYLDSIRRLGGLRILYTSRWQNTVSLKTDDSLLAQKLRSLSCVVSVEKVLRKGGPGPASLDAQQNTDQKNKYFGAEEFGSSYRQIEIHNGQLMHQYGFQGQGMTVAIMDAGFRNVDSLRAFGHLFSRNGILGTKDMYGEPAEQVFRHDNHGTYVLGVMAGYLPGQLRGTAPEANYYLIRTEFGADEFIGEEDAWAAGLEWADSAGVEVINSSLGYSVFTDSTTNHTYSQLDGKTTRIARSAGMAASKGMILVNSAGNSGNKPWHYITTPADAKDILAVGAVNINGVVASFSSRGPSSDGRMKPDVSAVGVSTITAALTDGNVAGVNGTSLASPVIAGLVTCLWQEHHHRSSYEIMDAVRRSANLYTQPNDSMGYGIPDFTVASALLRMNGNGYSDLMVGVFPNPFRTQISLRLYSPQDEKLQISLMDATGRDATGLNTVDIKAREMKMFYLDLPGTLSNGIYFLTITGRNGRQVYKLLRK